MKIKVPDITLVATDCTNKINETVKVLIDSSEKMDFGAIKLLSHQKLDNLPEYIQFEEIDKLDTINKYNYFMFIELGNHIQTSYAMTIQHDAGILHPELFDKNWLNFDYLGAPWKIVENSYMANNGERARVGNGGFSLRSKLLMNIPKKHAWSLRQEQGYANEDGNVCCYWRKELLELGIKYSPVEVAAHFSYENPVPENQGIKKFFGYHKHLPGG